VVTKQVDALSVITEPAVQLHALYQYDDLVIRDTENSISNVGVVADDITITKLVDEIIVQRAAPIEVVIRD